MAKHVHWRIDVMDALKIVYSKDVRRGSVGTSELREMLCRLAIHFARLTPDEIITASSKGQKLIATSRQEHTISLANITVTARRAEATHG